MINWFQTVLQNCVLRFTIAEITSSLLNQTSIKIFDKLLLFRNFVVRPHRHFPLRKHHACSVRNHMTPF